ncbi:MAG: hypothetical protein WDO14_16420 [Bacteroidota bacterium]
MKYLLAITLIILLIGCNRSPKEKAVASVNEYMKQKIRNIDSYSPVHFSIVDTLDRTVDSVLAKGSCYEINHTYTVVNANGETVPMSITFLLNKDYKVTKTVSKGVNGDYGSLSGNVYWKYNDFIGNRADAGAVIKLYPLDSVRSSTKYTAIADLQGNYKIDKILPGRYLVIITSKSTTACPEKHLRMIGNYADVIKEVFDFDIADYEKSIDEISVLKSKSESVLLDFNSKKYGGASERMGTYYELESLMRDKANDLINSFPSKFRSALPLYTGYSYSNDFEVVIIEEEENKVMTSDFGTTCL